MIKSSPSISIIIPCRNSGRWIGATLQSLVVQQMQDFEVVIVDDFSTDNTLHVVKSFGKSINIQIVSPKERLNSASASRNFGFQFARGKFIKFFDSDDLLSPDLLADQFVKIRGMRGAVAASSWCRFYEHPGDYGTSPLRFNEDLAPMEWILRSMEAGHSMMQCGMFLIPLEVIEKSGLWRQHPSPTDDFEFFIRLLLSSESVAATNGILWYRSGLHGSLSRKRDRQHAENASASIQEGLMHLFKSGPSSRIRPLAGRIYMEWACTMFPEHKSISIQLEREANKCGVTKCDIGGGRMLKVLSRLTGWRIARLIQYYVYRAGYERYATQKKKRNQHMASSFI